MAKAVTATVRTSATDSVPKAHRRERGVSPKSSGRFGRDFHVDAVVDGAGSSRAKDERVELGETFSQGGADKRLAFARAGLVDCDRSRDFIWGQDRKSVV